MDTEPLLVLPAWQDINCHKHKLFGLVSSLQKSETRSGDVTGERQQLTSLILMPQKDTDDNQVQLVVESCHNVTGNPKLPQRGDPKYAAHMLRVCEAVTAASDPIFYKDMATIKPVTSGN